MTSSDMIVGLSRARCLISASLSRCRARVSCRLSRQAAGRSGWSSRREFCKFCSPGQTPDSEPFGTSFSRLRGCRRQLLLQSDMVMHLTGL